MKHDEIGAPANPKLLVLAVLSAVSFFLALTLLEIIPEIPADIDLKPFFLPLALGGRDPSHRERHKTRIARTVGLEVSPALYKLLAALRLASGGRGSVFALPRGSAEAAAKRLRAEYGAPEGFTWQGLRRTCGTFLTNAPGIYAANT